MRTIAQPGAGPGDTVVAQDPVMLQVLETAQTLARHRAAVLITGETGVGKEVIARIIHRSSSRSSRPWVDVNCAALPEHLVESELFGYEKGAFSGADSAKPGLFEMADGGTLFLDEIGEIDPRVQVKLLRVLDSAPFYRLGGNRKVNIDVRLVAATNCNLEAAVHSGAFRRDLYHRITEFHIAVPPLRERPRDIAALAEHFLAQLRPDMSFTCEAVEHLCRLPWPGNVRELRNLVTRLGIAATHTQISADDVRRYVLVCPEETLHPVARLPEHAATITEMERLMIVRALDSTGGNQSLAAARLGIPRRTFCRKLNEHNITLGRRRPAVTRGSSTLLSNCRAELHVPVSVTTKDGWSTVAQASDLGLGGIGLHGIQRPLAVSDEVALQFTLPGTDRPIEAQATVAWYRADGTAGARFTCVSESAIEMLRDWIGSIADTPPPVDDILPQTGYPGKAAFLIDRGVA